MAKYRIWKEFWREGNAGLLIPEQEIKQMILTDEMVLLVRGIETEQIVKLNKKYETWKKETGDKITSYYDMEEFLKNHKYENATVEYPGDLTEIENVIMFHIGDQLFSNLKDCFPTDVYHWWDGSNMKTEIWIDENNIETRVDISDDYVDLDEWDGNDKHTGGIGHHARVYLVYEINGEKPNEPMFLLNIWSQWQGAHETGELVTLDELPNKLRELGRNPDEYMNEIKCLV